MAESKEVIDYLRNRQKAAEIEAKVNGINVWVLIGAAALIVWNMIGISPKDFANHSETFLRLLTGICALQFLVYGLSPRHGGSNEIRYTSLQTETPLLSILHGLTLLLPVAALGYYHEFFGFSLVIGLLGLMAVIIGIKSIVSNLTGGFGRTNRFPSPQFAVAPRTNANLGLVLSLLLIASIYSDISHMWNFAPEMAVDSIRLAALVGGLYAILLVLFERKVRSNSIDWTYALETELILGTVSPDVALRRIENRALGPKLTDVMDRAFDDLDRLLSDLRILISECNTKIESVSAIPREYSAERSSRMSDIFSSIESKIGIARNECSELGSYLKDLEVRTKAINHSGITSILPSLFSRHLAYKKSIDDLESEIRRMKRLASS